MSIKLSNLISLPMLSRALTAHSGHQAPGYQALYHLALEGSLPIERVGKRWFLKRDRLAETAELLGLTDLPASRSAA